LWITLVIKHVFVKKLLEQFVGAESKTDTVCFSSQYPAPKSEPSCLDTDTLTGSKERILDTKSSFHLPQQLHLVAFSNLAECRFRIHPLLANDT